MLYLTLRVLHIAAMATWFGANLFVSGDLRRALAAGPAHADLLEGRLIRANRASAGGAWGTLLTGLAMIFLLGGFGNVPIPVHVALLLSVVLMGVGAVRGRIALQAVAAMKAGADPGPFHRRTTALQGVSHLLWFTNLVLMVFRHGAV